MHAFKFMLNCGAWAEDLGYVGNAPALATAIRQSNIVKTWQKNSDTSDCLLELCYFSSSIDVRPKHRSQYHEASRPFSLELDLIDEELDLIDEWAEVCWQSAVFDYHAGLGFTCACLKSRQ